VSLRRIDGKLRVESAFLTQARVQAGPLTPVAEGLFTLSRLRRSIDYGD